MTQASKKSFRIVDLPQGSDEWRKWRDEGITATDAVVITGLSPFKTRWRLWAEKSGFADPQDLSGNPLVQKGNKQEPDARAQWEERHNEIVLPTCVESTLCPVIRASLDGLTSDGKPVEIKVPSDKSWQEVIDKGEASDTFKRYWPQCQHQMLALGAKEGWLVFYHARHGMKEFIIQRDDVFCRRIIKEAREFFREVTEKSPPEKDLERDAYIPEGEEAEQWKQAAYAYREYQHELDELKAREKQLKELQKPLLGKMKELMGDHQRGDYAGVMITRFTTSGSVDYRKIVEEETKLSEDEVEAYRKEGGDRTRVTVSEDPVPRLIKNEAVVEQATAPAREHIKASPF